MINVSNFELNSYLLHNMVEKRADSAPELIAIKYENEEVTYKDLNYKANQLANYLLENGIKPGDYVGISLERNASVLVSILAVLKTGAAYVPLDPNHPKSRLNFMIDDSGVRMILSDGNSKESFDGNAIRLIDLEQEDAISQQPGQNPSLKLNTKNLAYIIYTSGSTGQPKGVKVTHQNVLRLFSSTEKLFGFTEKDVWTLFHSYSFDFSVWEIWGALLYGGKLVVVPYLISRSPQDFHQLLVKEEVTVLNQTPTAFLQLQRVETVNKNDSNKLNLRFVIFGGEKLNVSTLKPWTKKHGTESTQLINMYGITETTVHVTYKKISKEDIEKDYNSIGLPIPDLKVYIVDKKMRPVPKGLVGELLIGGAGVTEGYHNLPDLTQERFIDHPNPNKQGEKLYRSGDLGKFHNNGEIEYLGRIDNQVKVRGFRIELGEIEKHIINYPSVEEVVVTVETDDSGEKNIVSYLISSSNTAVNVSDLRNFLKSKLPDYMIPNLFVNIAEVPLTQNGKVDFKQLSKMTKEQGQLMDQLKIEPRNDLDKKLCNIWSEVLHLPSLGIDDNFFDRGGHSLLVSKMIWSIKEELDISVPVKFIFSNPTIRELSNYIAADSSPKKPSDENAQIKPRKEVDIYPISYSQKGIWFQEQFLGINNAYNMCMPLKVSGKLNIDDLYTSFSKVVSRHETLRSSFINEFGIPVQKISNSAEVDFEKVKIFEADNIEDFIKLTCTSPFDLQSVAKLRVRVIETQQNEHIIILVLHHISSDAQSLTNLFSEVTTIYNGLSENTDFHLPSLKVQYADFAQWQNDWLASEEFKGQISFWKNELQNAPGYLNLKTDFPRHSENSLNGHSIAFEIETELTNMIRKTAREQNLTLYMLFMSAWKVLLTKYTGQTDIVIGSNVSNRRPETEKLIGLFVNTIPVRTIIDPSKTMKELFKETKRTILDAFSNQDVPFELLLSELQVERDPVRPALCQVFLSYQTQGEYSFPLKGMEVKLLPDPTPMIPYDMAVEIYDNSTEITGAIQYNQDLFLSSTIDRVINDYTTILRQIVLNPDILVKEIACDTTISLQNM